MNRAGFSRLAAATTWPPHSGVLARLRRRRLRAGLSVFGVLLGLVLAAGAIVGAVSVYNQGSESRKRSDAVRLVNQLKASVESTFAGSPSYGTSETSLVPTLARRGLIPDEALVANLTGLADDGIRNPFGGNVAITGNPGGGAPTAFEIQFGAVEEETCNHLGDGYVGRSRSRSGLVQMGVSTTDLTDPNNPVTTANNQTAPFTRGQLETLCANITATGAVSFRFR